jgi:hypothetical protein
MQTRTFTRAFTDPPSTWAARLSDASRRPQRVPLVASPDDMETTDAVQVATDVANGTEARENLADAQRARRGRGWAPYTASRPE